MNLYKVEFSTIMFFDEEGDVVEDPDNGSPQDIQGDFHVGAYGIDEAYVRGCEWLDAVVGEDEYTITSIKEKKKINVVNWPDDGRECQCLHCRTERAAEEDKLKFNCRGCDNEIVIVSDGWEEISCPYCGVNILRDRIIGRFNSYVMMDVDKLPKTKKPSKPKKEKKPKTDDSAKPSDTSESNDLA